MDQRMEFCLKALRSENFRELCREYGISAKTGYKWRERFLREGSEGMEDQSRRPTSHAESLEEREVCEIIRLTIAPTYESRRELGRKGGVRDHSTQAGAHELGAA